MKKNYIYIYSIFNISHTLCLRLTKSHPCNSLLIIEGFPRISRLHLPCPFWFYWIFNRKIIQNSITLVLGLVYTLQNPPWCTFIESFPTTQKSVVGGWLPWFGRSPCDKTKTNKQTNKQPSSIHGYKLEIVWNWVWTYHQYAKKVQKRTNKRK